MARSALVEWYYATTARYTSGPIGLGSYSSTIASLRGAMQPGQPVYASHINTLVDLYNVWIGHYHSMSDLYGVDTFGTWALFGGGWWYTTNTSGTGQGAQPTAGAVAGTSITTPGINHTVNVINLARSHSHSFTDLYWP